MTIEQPSIGITINPGESVSVSLGAVSNGVVGGTWDSDMLEPNTGTWKIVGSEEAILLGVTLVPSADTLSAELTIGSSVVPPLTFAIGAAATTTTGVIVSGSGMVTVPAPTPSVVQVVFGVPTQAPNISPGPVTAGDG